MPSVESQSQPHRSCYCRVSMGQAHSPSHYPLPPGCKTWLGHYCYLSTCVFKATSRTCYTPHSMYVVSQPPCLHRYRNTTGHITVAGSGGGRKGEWMPQADIINTVSVCSAVFYYRPINLDLIAREKPEQISSSSISNLDPVVR